MNLPILARTWHCERCSATARTVDDKTPMHCCTGRGPLSGLMVPLVLDGTKAKVEAVERGDWVGKETVQANAGGRPVMAAVITRDEGQDCTVYAPTAGIGMER